MITYLGHKVDVIDDKTRLLKNKMQSWNYGYDESIDTVIISKDGTLGEVYNVCGLNIGFPVIPDKKKIINYDKPKQLQKWKREELPKGLNEETWEESRFDDYIEKQVNYRHYGVWVYINGTPMYFPGTYWFFLQWIRIEEDYPLFRVIQNELMIFWEACKADKRSLGMIYVKNRRFGASSLAVAEILESGTIYRDKHLGLISKTGDDAQDIFDRIVTAFKRLPPFFIPQTDGTNTPKKVLALQEPTKKRKQGETVTEGDGLNTTIKWYNTAKNSMDGKRVFRSLLDECFAKGTKILMGDLSFKNIEDIKIGDEVIVEGGKKVTVGFTCSGVDDLYLIKQPYSKDYIVNSKHRLYLEQRCKVKGIKDDGVKIYTPKEFLELGKYKKRTTFGVRSLGIDLPFQQTEIDPYILGLWLGDGDKTSSSISINTKDVENFNSLIEFCKENNFSYSIRKTSSDNCKNFTIKRNKEESKFNSKYVKNRFVESLKKLGIHKNKQIPSQYINNSREVRLKLLAGLLDTDGSLLFKGNSYLYEISSSSKLLFEQISFICKSLGFKTCFNQVLVNGKHIAYKIRISGDIALVPCRIERKICPKDFQRKYADHINKISVESIGKGEYYGVTLIADNDNDRRLILEDFTISMNCGKYPKDVPFDKYWSVVKTSHLKGRVLFGKAMAVSTVNAMNDGGREYKNVYDNSNLAKRDQNNRTLSGLYSIFIPAKYCLEGYFDQYGYSIVEDPLEPTIADDGEVVKIGAVTYLKNILESLKDKPNEYNEQLRQFPDSERDAFRDEANETGFNIVHLLEQEEHNEFELEDNGNGNNAIERGNFHWKDGIQDTEVIWTPDPINGRFWISHHPPPEYRNRKKLITLHGITAYGPANEDIGCFGVDPYNRSQTVDKRGSKGSIHLQTKFNTGPFPNNSFILEYIDRAEKVTLFFEDVIMAMVYYSIPILPELSNESFLKTLVDRKYRWFIKNNPFKSWKDLSATEKEFGGVPAQDSKIGDQQYYALQSYIQDYIGVARNNDNRPLGDMGFMPFNRTIKQWKEADPNNRTKYDAYISSSLACIGNQRRVKVEIEKPKRKPITIKTYNNKGSISV